MTHGASVVSVLNVDIGMVKPVKPKDEERTARGGSLFLPDYEPPVAVLVAF
jgi:hypothetical protein